MPKNYQAKETVLVITVGLLALYVVFRRPVFLYCALGVGVAGVLSFYLSEKIHWAWNKLSLLMGAVSNRVLLGLVFFLVLTPMAVIRRLGKKDRLRRYDRSATSNFSLRKHVFEKGDMEKVWVLLVVALLGSMVPGAAGFAQGFMPVKEDSVSLLQLSAGYAGQYKQDLGQLPREYRKDYEELYTDRWKNIEAKFERQEIYTASDAQAYLDALTAEIVRGNPMLSDHPFHCYFSRSYVPNAAYIGEGIILVNMGLFYRLNNESEAAFVLCHEIAHYVLHHQENSMAKYVNSINSKETQEELR